MCVYGVCVWFSAAYVCGVEYSAVRYGVLYCDVLWYGVCGVCVVYSVCVLCVVMCDVSVCVWCVQCIVLCVVRCGLHGVLCVCVVYSICVLCVVRCDVFVCLYGLFFCGVCSVCVLCVARCGVCVCVWCGVCGVLYVLAAPRGRAEERHWKKPLLSITVNKLLSDVLRYESRSW